jgi:cell division protein FtsL
MTLAIYLNILLQTGIDDPNKFNGYLILGYIVMWLAFMVYIISLANKQRNTKQDIKLLQQLLKEDEESSNR